MRIPAIHGVIERRILVNFRVDPRVVSRLLPPPLEPKQASGYAVAGVCLIRLRHIRPAFVPLRVGLGSENAAHRIAVEWEQGGQRREGVYIPRRDSSSRLNTLMGGRLFPGVHHHARFEVSETPDNRRVALTSDDGEVRVRVAGSVADDLPDGSVFSSVAEASAFFEAGAVGYSVSRDPARLDGLELRCRNWSVQPLAVETVESSYFADETKFPQGSAVFDCALLMRNVEHEWHSRDDLCCGMPTGAGQAPMAPGSDGTGIAARRSD